MKINLLIIPFLALLLGGCGDENKSDVNQTKTSDAAPTASTTSQNQSASLEAPFELTLMDESKMTLQKFDKGFKVEGNDEAILFNFFANKYNTVETIPEIILSSIYWYRINAINANHKFIVIPILAYMDFINII